MLYFFIEFLCGVALSCLKRSFTNFTKILYYLFKMQIISDRTGRTNAKNKLLAKQTLTTT